MERRAASPTITKGRCPILVLSRKKSEAIVIDPRTCPVDEQGLIRIVVVELRGDKVRLGIDAPQKVACHRSEVFDAIERNGGDLLSGTRRPAPVFPVPPLTASPVPVA